MENHRLTVDDTLTKYFDVGVTNVLSEYFDVTCCGKGHYWFTPWENHCRKVFQLFPRKGYLYLILWGYNFDFIPTRQNSGRLVYHRTEKAVTVHIEDSFFNHISYEPDKLTPNESLAIREQYCLSSFIFEKMNISDVASAYRYIEENTRRNVPFMLDYFERVRTVDDMIADLNRQIDPKNMYHSRELYYQKAFLLAHQKRFDESIENLKTSCNGSVPEDLMKRLEKVYAEA